jgi:transposase
VILDNLNHHKGMDIRQWADENNVELLFTPTYASCANPIECHLGAIRHFVLKNCNYPTHRALAARLYAYLRWRNAK